jgi:hypothetical protein
MATNGNEKQKPDVLYKVVETNERVANTEPELITRWRWRAKRRWQKLEAFRRVPFYRYEIHRRSDGKWEIVAMQNYAEPIHGAESTSEEGIS